MGAGVAIFDGGRMMEERSLSRLPHATVFQAELLAILKALELCRQKQIFSSYSDSKTSVKALLNPKTSDKICMDIHAEMGTRDIRWNWVKAHVGTEGNETADRLEKADAGLEIIQVQVYMAAHAIKTLIRNKVSALWQKKMG